MEKLPKAPYLVVSKHQSAWDTFALVPLFRDPAIVLKDELKWIPFYGWFCVKFEHILVKRDKAALALKRMIADARQRASIGREIVIFPEGTRRPPARRLTTSPAMWRFTRGSSCRACRWLSTRASIGHGAASAASREPSSSNSSTRCRPVCRARSSGASSRPGSRRRAPASSPKRGSETGSERT